jgi:hypothetical protein
MAQIKSAVPGLSVKLRADSCITLFGVSFVKHKRVTIEYVKGTQSATWEGKIDKKASGDDYAVVNVKTTRSQGFREEKVRGTEFVTITIENEAPVKDVEVHLYDEA